jgi:uncharacterized protein YrrD
MMVPADGPGARLRPADAFRLFRLEATDGQLGTVKDWLFDDREWRMRYLVVDTGRWLPGRKVLVSLDAVASIDWDEGLVPVRLTKEQIRGGPSIVEDEPVSRQKEEELARHYGWPTYWSQPLLEGAITIGRPIAPAAPLPGEPETGERAPEPQGDPHLRSLVEVEGYHIHATDGRIGHLDDLVLDLETWAARYMVVDTSNWLAGRKVIVSTRWIEQIRWSEREVYVDLARETIERSPEYDPSRRIDRDYEQQLFDYYDRSQGGQAPGQGQSGPSTT